MLVKDLSGRLNRRVVPARRGAAAMLIISMMLVFIVVAGVTVDYAYMQMVRTDLRIATDAAAKAAAEALARTEDESQAASAALNIAGKNEVGGKPFAINQQDVVFGRITPSSNGKWVFSAGSSPRNAVQINTKVKANTFFGRALDRSFYQPTHKSIAGYQEYDVVLCLDRSHSMCFDMTGVDWVYPKKNPNLSSFTAWGPFYQNYFSPPHPVNSRWAVLSRAVNDFLEVANALSPQPYVGTVTWGSNITMPIPPYTHFPAATINVGLPSTNNFSSQMAAIKNNIQVLANNTMLGGTNLSAGLDMAVNHLTSNQARSLSKKIVILMTDGEWNAGRNPILAAQDAANKGVVVHTVSMLTNMQPVLSQIASITGGKAYTTVNEAQLRNAFKELASGLQVVMVE